MILIVHLLAKEEMGSIGSAVWGKFRCQKWCVSVEEKNSKMLRDRKVALDLALQMISSSRSEIYSGEGTPAALGSSIVAVLYGPGIMVEETASEEGSLIVMNRERPKVAKDKYLHQNSQIQMGMVISGGT